MHYNASQLKAIRHKGGPALVLAGPGSGKTSVITGRVHFLLEKGVPASKILVATFTKAAASEMRQRFFSAPGYVPGVSFGTFHSIFYYILRTEMGSRLSGILSEKESLRFLTREVRKRGLQPGEEGELAARVLSEILRMKSAGGEPFARTEVQNQSQMTLPGIEGLFEAYQDFLLRSGKLDFEDMQQECLRLLRGSPEKRIHWQQEHPYILVDEFQDISPVQFETVKCLLTKEQELFAVGDDDQCIYRFRGSSPDIMSRFPDYFPGAKTYLLDTNYRCGEEILKASSCLVGRNTCHIPKNFFCGSRRKGKVCILSFPEERDEAREVASRVQELLKKGRKREEIALLYRTAFEGDYPEKYLSGLSIPVYRKEKPSSKGHWVREDIYAYLGLSLHPHDRSLLLRILDRPGRGLPREGLDEEAVDWDRWEECLFPEEALQARKLLQGLELIARLPPAAAVHFIRHAMGYDSFLAEYAASKKIGLGQLLEIAENVEQEAGQYHTVEAMLAPVQTESNGRQQGRTGIQQAGNGTLQSGTGTRQAGTSEGPAAGKVFLSTIHGAKGLEFETVFILNVNEGTLPYKKASSLEEVEEERRLFYVGMTRAKAELFLCTSSMRHNRQQAPSRFLEELREDAP